MIFVVDKSDLIDSPEHIMLISDCPVGQLRDFISDLGFTTRERRNAVLPYYLIHVADRARAIKYGATVATGPHYNYIVELWQRARWGWTPLPENK